MASFHRSSHIIPLPNVDNLIVGDAVNKIDDEISRLKDHIRSLLQLRNRVIPVGRLPTEILLKVFLHCHEPPKSSDSPDSRLIVSWVSHHWRSVALGYPALWSFIDISHPELSTEWLIPRRLAYLQQCLVRSRDLPLSIKYAGPQAELFSTFLPAIHRVSALHIDQTSTESQFSPPFQLRDQSAPLLVSLTLAGVNLEGGLFQGPNLPPLQFLSLATCESFLDSPIISIATITTLVIEHLFDHIPPAAILERLQALPALRSCTLINCLELDTTVMDPPLYLPCLEYLSITDYYIGTISDVLHCLDIPNASLRLIHDRPQSQVEFRDSFEWSQSYQTESWNSKGIVKLSIKCEKDAAAGSAELINVTMTLSSGRQLTFGICDHWDYFEFNSVIIASEYLPLGEVPHICLSNVSVNALRYFDPLPRVQTLEFEVDLGDTDDREDFVEWVKSSAGEVFPGITKLKVNGVSYSGFERFLER